MPGAGLLAGSVSGECRTIGRRRVRTVVADGASARARRLGAAASLLPVHALAADAAAPGVGGALEMLGSLMLVLLVIFALAWLARWMQGARVGRGAAMQLHGGVQLGAKEKAVLLQVGDQQFLIGVAPGHVSLLHRFDTPVAEPSAAVPAMPTAFAERLRQALGGKVQP